MVFHMSARLLLPAMLLLCASVSCSGKRIEDYTFSEPTPPPPETVALCTNLCEACKGGARDDCLGPCTTPKNADLDCNTAWRLYLECLDGASDLTCDPGYLSAPSCQWRKEGFYHCLHRTYPDCRPPSGNRRRCG